MTVAAQTLLTLPDWRGGRTDAAFAPWVAGLPAQRLEQDDERWPQRGDWLTRLDTAVRDAAQKPVLVALGLGCALVQAWAAHTEQVDAVRGALLLAPADLLRVELPPQLRSWRHPPVVTLPFLAWVVGSSADESSARAFARDCGAHWCSAAGAGAGAALDVALTAQLNALLHGLATAPTDR